MSFSRRIVRIPDKTERIVHENKKADAEPEPVSVTNVIENDESGVGAAYVENVDIGEMKYKELQDYAKYLEETKEIDIDRSAKKADLLEAIKQVL